MPVYVAYNNQNKPINCVLAKSLELANAYWQGKEIIPHSTKELTADDLKDHPTGVLPVFSTKEVSHTSIASRNRSLDASYLLVD